MGFTRPLSLLVPSLAVDNATLQMVADTLSVKAAGITKTKLAGGFSHLTVQDGEDETSTNQITCAGMAVGDEVVAVIVLTTKAAIVTAGAHAGTLTAASGKITPGTKANNTGNQYLIFWNDLT